MSLFACPFHIKQLLLVAPNKFLAGFWISDRIGRNTLSCWDTQQLLFIIFYAPNFYDIKYCKMLYVYF